MKFNFTQAGFSLMELLVSMSIMIILTSLFIANFAGRAQNRDVNISANNLISDLHKIQSYALSSRDVTPGTPASQYGVTLSTGATSYTLLAYNNAAPAVASNLSIVKLPARMQISTISITKVGGGIVSPTSDNILFKIPFGKVVQNYIGSTTDELNDITTIKIASADNSVCSYVIVNGVTGNVTSKVPCP